ncbi:fungal-specific transcription factor domain-containing protein [Aspergillus heterothallicus]
MPQRTQSSTKRPARQQPGLACEECRRRKARCDRAQPQCGACMMTGRVCIVNHNRHRRGPKKGQLKALYSRLEVLEEQLVVQVENPPESAASHSRNSSCSQASLPDDEHDAPHEPSSSTSSFESDPILSSPIRDRERPSTSHLTEPLHPPPLVRLDVVQADLDQLYFDRVHPIAPFLHQRRYFTWVSYESPSLARSCLRLAMRTIAASMSAQYRNLADGLYAQARVFLSRLDGMERTSPLEHIQALLLLAHYELLRLEEGTAMVTAGRCFRLIQQSRLHDTDTQDSEGLPVQSQGIGIGTFNEAFAVAEERRRTFWVAYCFDILLSNRHEWPLTLQENAIRTRLPHSEHTFQTTSLPFLPNPSLHTHAQSTSPPPFLHEAIASSGHTSLPPFSECIVLATLYGRAMTLRHMAAVLPASDTFVFWSRYKPLSSSIEKRTQLLARNLASPNALVDPMVAFTHVLARATVVYLGEVAESVGGGGGGDWSVYGSTGGANATARDEAAVSSAHRMATAAYTQRAFQAAREVVRLVQGMRPVSCFKAHLFLPSAISSAARFLLSHIRLTEWEWGSSTNSTEREVQELLGVLRDLLAVNNVALELLGELQGSQGRTGLSGHGRETVYRHRPTHSVG